MVNWTDSPGSGQSSVVGFCERNNEHSGSVKGRKFFEYLSEYWLLKDSVHGVNYLQIYRWRYLSYVSTSFETAFRHVAPHSVAFCSQLKIDIVAYTVSVTTQSKMYAAHYFEWTHFTPSERIPQQHHRLPTVLILSDPTSRRPR